VSSGGPLERDAPALPSETPGEPRTGSGPCADTPGPGESESAGTVGLVYELATLLEPEAANWAIQADPVWRDATRNVAKAHAMKAIASGYRRVVEDDDTIDLVARAIHQAECGYDDLCQGYDAHGEWDRRLREDSYEAAARAAVRALRGDTQ
jgi:hypothetical protein